MPKKVKIGGQWVTMKDEDVQDAPAEEATEEATEEEATEEAPAEEATEEGAAEGDKALRKQAEALGSSIAKNVMAKLNTDTEDVGALKAQVERMADMMNPADSKLREILGGKDYIKDADELTKEEKIVGFWHACVTNNVYALKALSEGTDADGGYLFPNEFLQELVKELPEVNVMRNYVRIIPMRRNKMDITKLISGAQVFWTAENAVKSTTTMHFGQVTLTAFKMAAIIYSSDELIDDSDIFSVVQIILDDFAERIANEEEKVIWTGNGTTQPQGINAAGTIPTVAAVNQDFDDIKAVYYNLPRQYRRNAAWFMSDETAEEVSKLKDGNSNYIWNQYNVKDGEPGTIMGKSVVISNWVPAGSIFFGDMRRTYFLGDRQRMTVLTSQHTTQAFTQDETAIRVVSRIGGLVVLPNACRELTGF